MDNYDIMVYRDGGHPVQVFTRDPRDRELAVSVAKVIAEMTHVEVGRLDSGGPVFDGAVIWSGGSLTPWKEM